jgi:hypothetical protein
MFGAVQLPFWLSIAILSLVQAALVAVPNGMRTLPARLRSRRWALLPPASVVGFVLIASAAERASANGLTYLALVCVPPLAAFALTATVRGARPAAALAVPALFALAWADRRGLAGEGAALALSALSCVALGALLAALTPPRWLAAGIVAMAIADTVLVVSDLLQRPNSALNAAHPAAGLPRLQSAVFGSAVMGYGDLFVAGVLGGLLACAAGSAGGPGSFGALRRSDQLRGAALTAALALVFDLLFLAVDELPATVPVALALLLTLSASRRRSAARLSPRAGGPDPPAPQVRRSRAPAAP